MHIYANFMHMYTALLILYIYTYISMGDGLPISGLLYTFEVINVNEENICRGELNAIDTEQGGNVNKGWTSAGGTRK